MARPCDHRTRRPRALPTGDPHRNTSTTDPAAQSDSSASPPEPTLTDSHRERSEPGAVSVPRVLAEVGGLWAQVVVDALLEWGARGDSVGDARTARGEGDRVRRGVRPAAVV